MDSRAEFARRFELVAITKKWAPIMAKVGIRRAVAQKAFPKWHFVGFAGAAGNESRGIVDMIAIRKDHGEPRTGLKRGDVLQIVLIQVKGGTAAWPTAEDARRLRTVKKYHHAREVLLATWKKGKAAQFFTLAPKAKLGKSDWIEVEELSRIFN